MRCLIPVLIAGFAVLCAGCLQDSYYWSTMFPKSYQRTRMEQEQSQEQPELAQSPSEQPPSEVPPGAPPLEPPPSDEAGPAEPPREGTVIEAPGDGEPGDDGPPPQRLIERTTRRVLVQPQRIREPEKVMPQEPRFYAGLSFGNVYGNKGEAIDDERDTDFDNGTLFGVQIGFLPRMPKTIQSPYFQTRYGIEVRLQEHSNKLDWDGLSMGDVHVNSAVFAFKLFQMPKEDGVFGFHLEAGMGWGTTWFDKDDMLKQDDIDHGRYTKVDVDSATIFAIGAGADLYVAPDACVTLGFRFQAIDIPLKWSVDGVYDRHKERLNASNGQVILSFNFFF